MDKATWTIAPCPAGELRTLDGRARHQRRRWPRCSSGAATPIRPRRGAFLEGALPGHDPFALGDMARGGRARSAPPSTQGKRICVHGDYDADGICATALAVFLLRELGADPRLAPAVALRGGLRPRRRRRSRKLAADGVDLVLTVDCGITAVAEVEEATRLGLEVVVTDHHRPGDDVPRLPGRRAAQGRLPVRRALRHRASSGSSPRRCSGRGHPFLDRHLDVVALATVADVVPLVDENRALALAGLRRLAQTQKPGLRALMRVAGVDPAACDEGAIGFRLAPRINASGRLGRPEAALALLLTDDPAEAKRLAEQLEDLNRERQAVEERILRAAIAEIESWPEARRRHRGYVVAGEDWHEGVIGIVASRLVERFGRPVVLIAGSASGGDWKGSGRAGGSFDLHGALTACAGAPRALRRPSRRGRPLDPPRAASRRSRRRSPRTPTPCSATTICGRGSPSTRSSAAPSSGSRSCHELARLAPFGLGNPGITLLVDDCELDRARHGRRRASTCASAFASAAATPARRSRSASAPSSTATAGSATTTSPSGSRRTAGTARSSPQLVVRRIFDTDERYEELRAWFAEQWRRGEAAWTPEVRAVFDELGLSARTASRCAEPARVGDASGGCSTRSRRSPQAA